MKKYTWGIGVWRYPTDEALLADLVMAKRENRRLRGVLENVRETIGPKLCSCPPEEESCLPGLRVEVSDSLQQIKDALR